MEIINKNLTNFINKNNLDPEVKELFTKIQNVNAIYLLTKVGYREYAVLTSNIDSSLPGILSIIMTENIPHYEFIYTHNIIRSTMIDCINDDDLALINKSEGLINTDLDDANFSHILILLKISLTMISSHKE